MTESRPEWIFHPRDEWSKHRDPIQGEFFSSDSIPDVTDALVREAVQNSLDASEGGRIRMRFALGSNPAETANRYLEQLWPHVEASEPEAAADHHGKSCRFLTIEDFDTTGLRGDPAQMFEEEAQEPPNDFFYFFRAEGKSGKSGADRGRWGVGKYVFPMASGLNAFFALTIRSGQADPLLMGQAVLKNHQIDDSHFTPDGWFALDGKGPLPATATDVIDEFSADWGIRRDGGTGLSVVIPHIADGTNAERLTEAIVTDYFGAVLGESLTVSIEDEQGDTLLDASTFDEVFGSLDEATADRVTRFIGLYRFGLDQASEIVETEPVDRNPAWTADLLTDDVREALLKVLSEPGGRSIVRVPVVIRRKIPVSSMEQSWFDVVLEADPGAASRALFLREGIRVSEVDSGLLQGVHALVVVTDPVLARMLGDAEGPAHTTWSARTAKFKGRYMYGQQWISFIKRAPKELLRLLHKGDEHEDRTLAAQYFPVPGSGPERERSGPKGGADGPVDPPPPPPEGRPKPRVQAIDPEGFAVTLPTDSEADRLVVRLAYDVRRGNPLKRWSEEDFSVGALDVQLTGGSVSASVENAVEITISDRDGFRYQMTGFDPNRDLYVVAREVGDSE